MKIVISSGHGKYIRGARGNPVPPQMDEVDEARKVVEQVATELRALGVDVTTYHDDVSRTQDENLKRITDFHNSRTRDLDVSVHFNAYNGTAHGTECLYVTQSELAGEVAAAVATAGQLTNRGGKKRTDLYFLNNTAAPAILIETAFCDNTGDCELVRQNFDLICAAIADAIADEEGAAPSPPEPEDEVLFQANGRCSWFGGPDDAGVAPDEGLAFIYSVDQAPQLFLPQQPSGTSGLARRLDPDVFYFACRFDYAVTPKDMLANPDIMGLVRAGDREFAAWPADWGPHQSTGRVADISPGLMAALGIETDDNVEIVYPAAAQPQPEPEPPGAARVDIVTTGPVTITINGVLVTPGS